MDLLRHILVRLPLKRILQIPEVVDANFIKLRLRVVNHFPRGEERAKDLPSYARLCAIQGEFGYKPRDSSGIGFLSSRAAVVADVENYEEFCKKVVYTDIRIGLLSESPRIRWLAVRYSGRRSVDQILDPTEINWESESGSDPSGSSSGSSSESDPEIAPLKALVLSRVKSSALKGYLRYPRPPKKSFPEYVGYLIAAMQRLDPFATHPELERILSQVQFTVDVRLAGGYFGTCLTPNPDLLSKVCFLQPKLIKYYLENHSKITVGYLATVTTWPSWEGLIVTEDIAKDSRSVLGMSDIEKEFSPYYRQFLRILSGRRVDFSNITETESTSLADLMLSVAHPQLSEVRSKMRFDQYYALSSVFYDPIGYFRVYNEHPDNDVEWHILHRIVAAGKALELFDAKLFDDLWRSFK